MFTCFITMVFKVQLFNEKGVKGVSLITTALNIALFNNKGV